MHAMDDDVNMRHYGGLARLMPLTFATFAAGYLAIIGFPLFSGYFSKDHIIEAAFERSLVIGLLAMLGAGVTAFYMTRLVLMTFLGAKRWEPGVHPHESPLVMTVPLVVLGAASVFGGAALNGWIEGWLEPAVGGAHGAGEETGLLHFSLVGVLTLVVVAAGVAVSVLLFGPRRTIPTVQPASRSPLTLAGRRDLYGDALNEAVLMRPGQRLTAGLTRFDRSGVDGVVNGTATAIADFSGRLRRLQNGFVRSYALTMMAGAAVVGAVLVLGRLG